MEDKLTKRERELQNKLNGHLVEISSVLTHRYPLDLQEFLHDELQRKIRTYQFDAHKSYKEEDEVQVLIDCYNVHGDKVIDMELISSVIRKLESSQLSSEATLTLLRLVLAPLQYSFNRDRTGDLRRSVVVWIDKFIQTPTTNFLKTASAKDTFRERLQLALNSLSKQYSNLNNYKLDETVLWCIQVYIESLCIGARSKDTIKCLQILSNYITKVHSTIINILNTIIRSVANSLRPQELLELLFPNQRFMSVSQHKNMSSFHRILIRDIMYDLIISLNESTSKGEDSQTFMEMFNDKSNGLKIDILSLYKHDSSAWFHFLIYYQLQNDFIDTMEKEYKEQLQKYRIAKAKGFKNEDGDIEKLEEPVPIESYPPSIWRTFTDFSEMIINIFKNMIPLIEERNCKIEFLIFSANSKSVYYEQCWNYLEERKIYEQINLYYEKALEYKDTIAHIRTVCETLFPNSEKTESVKKFFLNFNNFTLKQINVYLGYEQDENINNYLISFQTPPISDILMSSLSWLNIMIKSKLFLKIYQDCEFNEILAIIPSSVTFSNYYHSLISKNISFKSLSFIAPYLLQKRECAALIIGGKSFIRNDNDISWIINKNEEIDKDLVLSLGKNIKQWQHLDNIKSRLPEILRVIDTLSIFLSDNAKNELEIVKTSTLRLQNQFNSYNYSELTLNNYTTFHTDAQNIDSCFTKLNPDLFELIPKCMNLLDWLRSLPNDNDFTSSIELAMGKSEMECPASLWEEEPGKPGRVSEEKLSMVSTVRRYLYSLIYRTQIYFENLNDLLSILRELRPTDNNIISSLKISSEYTDALMELLDDNKSQAAPDRLLSLLSPHKKTTWKCSNNININDLFSGQKDIGSFSNTVGQVWLEWEVERKMQIETKTQNINELMDFQSTIVLGSTDTRKEKYQQVIDNFIQQFGWMKHLWNSLSELHKIGHFDFRIFSYEFPITCNYSEIRNIAIRAASYLDKWTKQVYKERSNSYFLNFYSMRHLWNIVSILDNENNNISDDEEELEFKNILSCINLDYSLNPEELEKFIINIKKYWNEGKKAPRSAIETLKLCAISLEKSLQNIPIRNRKAQLDILNDIDNEIENTDTKSSSFSGLHIICADSSGHVYDHIISAYARLGYLPEYGETYICNKLTTWEDLITFIQRWALAYKYNRSDRLYTLGCIEYLSFELQRKLVSCIRDSLNISQNPLLIISGRSENQHIITQFSHCRTNITPLPEDIIRKFSSIISQQYSNGINIFTGYHAGCGKTFQIRKQSENNMSNYYHLPVLSSNNILNELLKRDDIVYSIDYITIHFDIADNIREEFSSFLFNIIFLGGVYNTINGNQFFWDPEKTTLAFEMPTAVYNQIRLAKLLPQYLCIVNENTFCSSQDDLQQGMGNAFNSSRYDGTSMRKIQDNKIANAYERLRYISLALQILKSNNGRFPYIDESVGSVHTSLKLGTRASGMVLVDPQTNDVSSSEIYKLLSEAIKFSDDSPSLWCIWNFINIFYWQLRDMHHPDSPINCACMPDKYSERDDDEDGKAKIKGEVIQFLIRTAREFATRQQHKEDLDRVSACKISGMSRWEFNGVWTRMEFDNDGEPCFRKTAGSGVLYLYYRYNSKQWVIDDIMEATGATFASSKGSDINSVWVSSPDWKIDPNIRIREGHHANGHLGKAIVISGIKSKIKNQTENGTYLLQPPYDDIAGHSHYIMNKGEYRRHLFWSEIEQLWQICPVCNNEEGAFALSCSEKLSGQWRIIPADVVESNTKLEFISLAQFKLISGNRPIEKPKKEEIKKEDKEENNNNNDNYVEFETMEEIWDNTVKWNDSNHECLLFSNEVHVVRFLSLDPKKMRDRMHPGLLNHLQQNRINVGEDLDTINGSFHEILSSLTEVKRSAASGKALLDGKYCLTGDSLLKMLAIFARLRCGVPVVLMGECGCGKTMLIKYLCAWMGVKLLILDVHGGTSEDDILNVFKKASNILTSGKKKNVFIFLDEINTCNHMGLMNEAISHRSLQGQPISDRIHILAALNPYRKRPEREQMPGLVYQLHNSSGIGPIIDPMSKLVYRVHPIPHTLRDFIFDFGALTPEKEIIYIFSMVSSKFPNEIEPVRQLVTELIAASQEYIRFVEKEASATSLRDVRRCLNLIEFFCEKVNKKKTTRKKVSISPFACSVVLGLAFVYYYRLGSLSEREEYWNEIGTYSDTVVWNVRKLKGEGFDGLKKKGAFQKLLNSIQQNFCNNVKVEDGIAMNQALMENLFVVLICILNKIPVFLVGKPGSSKTLTMQVIASNLQGKQSEIAFWRKFPAIYIFQYQCSPMSDSHSIQHQFDMAVRYQQHAENTITVLLLDEVGLAEHSPDMPLKVLHGMLVDPPVSVVGLSNWVLDPAKMNRAICLQRTEPSQNDIQWTGQRILSSAPGEGVDNKVIVRHLTPLLTPLATAYHQIYTKQKGRDFVGMRDYYNLVKLLRTQLSRSASGKIDTKLLTFSLCRNFGGKPELMQNILKTFHKECFKLKFDKKTTPSVQQLVSANLNDKNARHLMLLTKNGAALPLLFGTKLLDELQTTVLIGSEFPDDKTELHLVTQINQVKLAMANGSTVILLNHDNIYEALYDVLNQRYLYKSDGKTGKILKLLRLAIGSRSQLCNVKDGFKIVVIVEQDHAYRDLDLPLLNRFEKQVLCPEDVLTSSQTELCKQAYKWIENIVKETGLKSIQDIFCGFHRGTVPSAILNIIDYGRFNIQEDDILNELKKTFSLLALPIGIITSSTLTKLNTNYFKYHANFNSILNYYILPKSNDSCTLLLTYSPSSHFDIVLQEYEKNLFENNSSKFNITPLQLGEISSERVLKTHFSNFFNNNNDINNNKPISILVVQCDPLTSSQTLIDHSRHICTQEYSLYKHNEDNSIIKKHVIFLIHLPPGLKQRQRKFSLDYQSLWDCYFVDDLRATLGIKGTILDTIDMLQNSAYDLVKNNMISLQDVISSRFQYALSCCTVPSIENIISYYSERIKIYRNLFANKEFNSLIYDLILNILEYHKDIDDNSLHKHVKMASIDLAGSLRQSLELALHTMILQSLAHCFLTLDCNFNVRTAINLKNDSFELLPIWMKLVNSKLCLNIETFVTNAKIGEPSFSVPINEIPNTGTHGPIMAKFPFSYKLCPLLNQKQLQSKVKEVEGSSNLSEKFYQICVTLLGNDLIILLDNFGNNYHSDYLHDFISIETSPIPGLSIDKKQQIYEIIINTTNINAMKTICGIHTAIWENEARIFAYCSLLSCSAIPKFVRNTILDTLKLQSSTVISNDNNNNKTPSGNNNQNQLLLQLDLRLIEKLLSSLWDRFNDSALNEITLKLWNEEVAAISNDITYLLSISKDLDSYIDLCKSWLGIRLACIFLQEIAKPYLNQVFLPKKVIHFRKVAQNCNISSLAYLKSLIATILYGFDSNNKEASIHASNFIRRYVQEIIFGEQEGFLRIGLQTSIDNDLIKAFEYIINASDSLSIDPLLQIIPTSSIDIPLRRVLVHCLVRAHESGLIKSTIQLYTNEGKQIYLQYWEDNLTEKAASTLPEIIQFNNTHLEYALKPSSDQETPEDIRKYLESIARARFTIQSYSKNIVKSLQSKNIDDICNLLPKELDILLNNYKIEDDKDINFIDYKHLGALLTLKYLRNRFGIDSLIDLMELPEKYAPWILCNRNVLTQGEISLADPFSIIFNKQEYEEICSSVRLLTTSSAQNINLKTKIPIQLFTAAIFSQVFMPAHHLDIKRIKKPTEDYIKKLSFSDKGNNIVNWLINMSFNGIDKNLSRTSTIDMLMVQIMTHLSIIALELPTFWLSSIILHPDRLGIMYLPFITHNALLDAVEASGSVGWYLCPKGHPYSVGGCHLPMEISVCLHPGCGAQIGGRNHVSVRGVKKLNVNEMQNLTKPGYMLDDTFQSSTYHSVLHTEIVRLLIHLSIALGIDTCSNSKTLRVLTDHLQMKTPVQVKKFMFIRARDNIKKISNYLEFGDTDSGLTIHLILRKILHDKILINTEYIPSMNTMKNIERSMKIPIEQTITGIRRKLRSLGDELQQGSRIASARTALGKQWDYIHEIDDNPKPNLDILFWRYREPVTFDHFNRVFTSRSNAQDQYPLLYAFLKEEQRLHMIKYTADILAWHNILFEMFPPSSLTREQAANITNAQAIEEYLPKERQIEAFRIFQAFAIAFNECLPLIDRIYECEPNPFITGENGSVDLSGARSLTNGIKMSEDCSINFSLPSMVRGANDAMGLCTIRLLELMQNAQGEVLTSFTFNKNNNNHKNIISNDNNNNNNNDCNILVNDNNEINTDEIPSISYMTDHTILRQQLIMYDREKDLMPLLQIFANQSLEYGQGMYLDYDFDKIQSALANSLISGKMPLKLQIRHFQYHGDVKNAGHLSELHLRVPQKPLTPSVLESIWNEIDTRDRLMKLMRQVEMCISFIGSIASSTQADINGQIYLHNYILNTLLIDSTIWSQITTQSITQHVQLCHLQSLYMELEEKMYGSPLDKVAECYREFPSEEIQKQIRNNAKYLDITCLIPILRQFLVQQLCEAKWEANAQLKEYLTYVSASVDLNELEWFDKYFPESLELQHTYQIYYQLLEFI